MLLDSNVVIYRDGTISFSLALCAQAGLHEGKTLSIFYSQPGKFLLIKPLRQDEHGVPMCRNERGALVAEQAADFLEQFGILRRKRTYAAHWNPTRGRIVVWLNLPCDRTAMRIASGPEGLHEPGFTALPQEISFTEKRGGAND
jgi:hypothetical protein